MAQFTTTYEDMRAHQEETHPDALPEPTDLVYVQHGTGSDRNRVFTLQEIYDVSKEYVYIQDDDSLTSRAIVEAYKTGKIPVVWIGGGSSGVATRMYFYPKKIYYNENGTLEIDRDCVFYGVGLDDDGNATIYVRRYYNIPVQGQGEKRTLYEMDVSAFDEDGNLDVDGYANISGTVVAGGVTSNGNFAVMGENKIWARLNRSGTAGNDGKLEFDANDSTHKASVQLNSSTHELEITADGGVKLDKVRTIAMVAGKSLFEINTDQDLSDTTYTNLPDGIQVIFVNTNNVSRTLSAGSLTKTIKAFGVAYGFKDNSRFYFDWD